MIRAGRTGLAVGFGFSRAGVSGLPFVLRFVPGFFEFVRIVGDIPSRSLEHDGGS